MSQMTEAERAFLVRLNADGSPTGSWLIHTATREQDKARSSAKKNGWAVFDRKNWAWRITDLGLEALKSKDH